MVLDMTTDDEAPLSLLTSPFTSAAFGDLLGAMSEVETLLGQRLYLVGGALRNVYWDRGETSHLANATDYDVVFFPTGHRAVPCDAEVVDLLSSCVPGIAWSCKNLLTVRTKFRTVERYRSLWHALSDFPETASAVAVRAAAMNCVEVVAPFGIGDALRGIIRPTSVAALPRVLERASEKRWLERWPHLSLQDPQALGFRKDPLNRPIERVLSHSTGVMATSPRTRRGSPVRYLTAREPQESLPRSSSSDFVVYNERGWRPHSAIRY
jgi:uncharacterized protein